MRSLSRLFAILSCLLLACTGESAPPPPLPLLAKPPAQQVSEPVREVAAPEPTAPALPPTAPPAEPPKLPLEVAVDPQKPAPPPKPSPERPSHPLLGDFRCKFDDYPPMRCTISKRGAAFWLEKTQGSQRIRGKLVQEGDELTFSGEFFCPMGACTSPVRATLRKTSAGWAGTLLHDQDGTPMRTPLVLSR